MRVVKPIFIISAPRSGSTLLFETLIRHKLLWSFGDEGHGWIERFPQLRPLPGGVDSNRLTKANLNESLAEKLKIDLLYAMKNVKGEFGNADSGDIRTIEKTPKNCLRIPFINALYPDARFIYLYRDPKAAISSIIEGWRYQRFVTYGDVRMTHGRWCFLRPPNWQNMLDKSLQEISAFQWKSCQNIILDDLSVIESSRWMSCSLKRLLNEPLNTIRDIQHFCELNDDKELSQYCSSPLPNSKYTLTIPAKGKWRQNESLIAEIFPTLIPTINRINSFVDLNSRIKNSM